MGIFPRISEIEYISLEVVRMVCYVCTFLFNIKRRLTSLKYLSNYFCNSLMSNLLTKSQLSFGSAEFLQKSGHTQSVVHCSYYSCVQLMKHVLIKKDGYSDATLEAERIQKETQVHVFLIKKLVDKLRNEGKDWSSFLSEINDLKKLRGIVDYTDTAIIDSSKSGSAIDKARKLNNILKALL